MAFGPPFTSGVKSRPPAVSDAAMRAPRKQFVIVEMEKATGDLAGEGAGDDAGHE